MFFDTHLMNSEHLGKVWKIANNIGDDTDEDIDMPKICNSLDSWVDSRHDEIRKRLSLRTSSALINGAVRLYKRKVHQLYEDSLQLDNDVTFRKKIRYSLDSFNVTDLSPTFTEDSEDIATPYGDSVGDSSEQDSFLHESRFRHDSYNSTGSSSRNCEERQITTADKSTQVSPPSSSFDENLPFGYIVIHDNYKDRIPSRIIFSSLNLDVNKLG